MHYVDVQRNISTANKIIQIKIHANCLGGQFDGRVDVDRDDSLLHVAGVEVEVEGDIQDIQQFDHKPVYNILSFEQAGWKFIEEVEWEELSELVFAF